MIQFFGLIKSEMRRPLQKSSMKLLFFILITGGCGGNLSTDAGSLTSPNFPSDYPNNKECIHSIKVSPGKVIKLDFHTYVTMAGPQWVY